MKGRGALQVRFDSLTLANGVTRSFHSDLGAIDPQSNETLEREGSKVKSGGSKTKDTVTVVGSTAAGTVIGSGVGGALGHAGMGGGIGAAGGAATGLIGVLTSRGPDAVLTRGSTVEMVLDRTLAFEQSDLDPRRASPHPEFNGSSQGPRSF
jgi:type IV secretion system protein VirB10